MDKLEMKITLTQYSAPRLLAYLDATPGARERALVVKLLVERALEAGIFPLGPPAPSLPAATPTTTPKKPASGVAVKRKSGTPPRSGRRPATRAKQRDK
jgi:hypothetical protein